MKRQNNKN